MSRYQVWTRCKVSDAPGDVEWELIEETDDLERAKDYGRHLHAEGINRVQVNDRETDELVWSSQ